MHKTSTCGGVLDVDRMQDCSDPVENIVWKNKVLKIDFFLILCAHTFQRKKNQKKKSDICVYIYMCFMLFVPPTCIKYKTAFSQTLSLIASFLLFIVVIALKIGT
jgi:hypothetical protein